MHLIYCIYQTAVCWAFSLFLKLPFAHLQIANPQHALSSSILDEFGYISKHRCPLEEHPYRIKCESEQEWQSWFDNVLQNHATWNCNGSTPTESGNSTPTTGERAVKVEKSSVLYVTMVENQVKAQLNYLGSL